jgi:hypothetical protein
VQFEKRLEGRVRNGTAHPNNSVAIIEEPPTPLTMKHKSRKTMQGNTIAKE